MAHKPYDSIYVFSSDQQMEVQKIYQKYSRPGESRQAQTEEEAKLAQLRRLDRSVTSAGVIAALLTGTCGAVVHGIGITLIQGDTMFALGTGIAILGLMLFLAAYPVYCVAVKRKRRKVEAQILKLCKELMK